MGQRDKRKQLDRPWDKRGTGFLESLDASLFGCPILVGQEVGQRKNLVPRGDETVGQK
jgi:hypothetical protein